MLGGPLMLILLTLGMQLCSGPASALLNRRRRIHGLGAGLMPLLANAILGSSLFNGRHGRLRQRLVQSAQLFHRPVLPPPPRRRRRHRIPTVLFCRTTTTRMPRRHRHTVGAVLRGRHDPVTSSHPHPASARPRATRYGASAPATTARAWGSAWGLRWRVCERSTCGHRRRIGAMRPRWPLRAPSVAWRGRRCYHSADRCSGAPSPNLSHAPWARASPFPNGSVSKSVPTCPD